MSSKSFLGGKCRGAAFRFVIFALFCGLLFRPTPSQASVTDFFQTSQAMEVNLFLPTILSLIPDPSLTDESMVTVELLPFGAEDQLGDGPLLTHLFRRNPEINTLSQILFTFLVQDDQNPDSVMPVPFIPLFGESGWVVGVTGGGNQELIVAGVPLSLFDVPVGSSAQAPLVDKSVPHVEFDDHDLRAPSNFGVFLSHFYDSALPSGNNPMEFIMIQERVMATRGDRELVYLGVKADITNGNLTLTEVPITPLGLNVGPPKNNGESSSSVNVLWGDYNGDGCNDLALLVDFSTDADHDFLVMMKGKCDGSLPPFEAIEQKNAHDLGPNAAVTDLVNGDFNKDGHLDLGIVYALPGGKLDAQPSRIDIIEDLFGSFAVHSGPSISVGETPLFADRMDCNVDFIDDMVVTGVEIKSSSDREPESFHSSDVICFLSDGQGGFPNQVVVYPKDLINPAVPSDLQDQIAALPITTSVGNIGCGTGFVLVSFFTVKDNSNNSTQGQTSQQGGEDCGNGIDDDGDGKIDCEDPDCNNCQNNGGNIPTGAYTALFAEHSDCDAVASALAGGDGSGGGDKTLISGGGCISQMIPGSNPLPWGSMALSLFPLLVLGGRRWVRKTRPSRGFLLRNFGG